MHLYVYPSPHSGTFHPNKTGILALTMWSPLTIYIIEGLRVIFANISESSSQLGNIYVNILLANLTAMTFLITY